MSGQEALLLHLRSTRGESLVLPCPSDLRFDRTAPGGFKSLSCTLTFPPGTATPAPLAVYSTVRVVDRRTGRIVWYGRITDPGLSISREGQPYALTAEGPQSELGAWREVYGLVDRSQESWQGVGDYNSSASFTGVFTPPGDYTFDLGNIDIGDFGGELALTTPDLDLGNLTVPSTTFTGADFPASANYPGYLGYLQNPTVGIGAMKPIPLGGTPPAGDWWTPGFGTGASSLPTGGRLTASTGRHPDAAMVEIGHWEIDPGSGLPVPVGGAESGTAIEIFIDVTLVAAGAVGQLWIWTDSGVSGSDGWYVTVNDTGTLTIQQVISGVTTELATYSKTLTPGTTYQFRILTGTAAYIQVGIYGPGEVPATGTLEDVRWFNYFGDPLPPYFITASWDGTGNDSETAFFAALTAGTTRYFAAVATSGSVDFTNYQAILTLPPEP